MSDLHSRAAQAINEMVERFGGNWREVRKEVLADVGLLMAYNSSGARDLANAMEHAYQAMKPKASGRP